MGLIKKNFSVANVMSATALMVALGGTSYAAITLPNNSVGSQQIKSNAVKGSDIASAAVTSSDVKNGSLTTADFKPGQIPAGPKGDKGDKGDKGGFGAVISRAVNADVDLADGNKQSYTVFCAAGEQAIGGGGRGDANNSEATIVGSSRPVTSADNTEPPAEGTGFTGWRLTVANPAGGVTTGIRPSVYVFCVPAAS